MEEDDLAVLKIVANRGKLEAEQHAAEEEWARHRQPEEQSQSEDAEIEAPLPLPARTPIHTGREKVQSSERGLDLDVLQKIVAARAAEEPRTTCNLRAPQGKGVADLSASKTPGAYLDAPGVPRQRTAHVRFSLVGAESDGDSHAEEEGNCNDPPPQSPPDSCSGRNKNETVANKPEAVAILVPEEEDLRVSKLQLAEEVDPSNNQRRRSMNKCKTRRIFVGGAVTVAAGVILLLVFGLADWSESDKSVPSTVPPSPAPSLSLESHVYSLLPDDTILDLDDPYSPQSKAFEWLLEDPNIWSYKEERIVQRFALATLYHATNGYNWHNNTFWLSHEHHECQWHSKMERNRYGEYDKEVAGLYNVSSFAPFYACENDGELHHLWLYNNNLKGELPRETYLLTDLRSILLDANSGLEGSTIASEIGMLTNLELLSIWSSRLGGTLPTEIGLLSNIREIGLGVNHLQGTLPSELFQLVDLPQLVLEQNDLTGTIPSEVGLMTGLNEIFVDRNNLGGNLPSELCLLTGLTALLMHNNDFTGTIHSEFGLMQSLKAFALQSNPITGTIPSQLAQLPLWYLSIESASLTGTIPTQLGAMSYLDQLWLSNNSLSGSIPRELGQTERLSWLLVESNLLSGRIPTELGSLENLYLGVLFDNLLSGGIPSEIGRMRSLKLFVLSANQLTGTIPEEVQDLELDLLHVVSNELSGTIPNGLCGIGSNATDCLVSDCGLYFECSDALCGCECPCVGGNNETMA